MGDPALAAWAREVERPAADIDLGRAALALARMEYPALDVPRYLARLDALAAAVTAGPEREPMARLHRVREHLFAEEGFAGNTDDYYDPRNSFLNDVLDRRVGIPITLALVLIEIGRRVGLTIEGVGLPGHFIAAARVGRSRVLLDPFHGGTVLTPQACRDLVVGAVGRPVTLAGTDFAPVDARRFLARMLANLKGIYWRQESWERVVAVIDRLLILDPTAAGERRDRGLARTSLGDYQRGLADWERYLTDCPDAPDGDRVRARLRQVREGLAQLN